MADEEVKGDVKPKGLRAKLCEIMGQVGYIEKRGKNEAQHYDYVMAADINASMGKLMAERGICIWPRKEDISWTNYQTSKGTAMFLCRAQITYVFSDAETSEEIEVPSTGEGMDVGDKAVFKARTGALKYALIQTFLIASGDDPESEREEHNVDAPKDAAKVEAPPAVMVCPECGVANSIIKSRPEFGGGYLCYKKKGGCNARFSDTDPRLNGGRLSSSGPAVGNSSGPVPEKITAEQVIRLESWCMEFNVAPMALIRQYQTRDKGVARLADLTQEMYDHAETVFNAKRAKLN